MAATLSIQPAGNAIAPSKFRAPRVRPDAIARDHLLERLHDCIEKYPVTLVCAPGGFGKTTLLAQLAAHAAEGTTVLWVTLDEDDDDPHRFFAALLGALLPLPLVWETPPESLLALATGSDSQYRAAMATLVNALCTARSRRIILLIDDLHRLSRPEVFEVLESMIERLPDHVSLALGTRVEPPLPLVRWRAHGELAEIIAWDLQFSEAEARELMTARMGEQLQPERVKEIWRRTHGWPVGLTLALQAQLGSTRSAHLPTQRDSDRHFFAYFAQEIFAELPEHVRDFMLRCSVLHELSPHACAAVSGQRDAHALLDLIYQRNLFVTVVDDSVPILHFHDLFREFLELELTRRLPQLVRDLHERAGQVEPALGRAIAHFLRAQSWDNAARLIATKGEAMLAEGDHITLERWLEQVPAEARSRYPVLRYLAGACAWLKWDWDRARAELGPAIAQLRAPDQQALRLKAMFLQVDALNSSGDAELAWQLLDEIEQLPLDELSHAQVALQRAWCILPRGEPQRVGELLTQFVLHAEQDPASICPITADRVHLLCIGLPQVADAYERYFSLTEVVRGESIAPWQLAALAIGAWANFWKGRREPLLPILARGEFLQHKFGSIRSVADRLHQFRALFLAASGQYAHANALSQALIDALQRPEAVAHRAVWLRAYQHARARICWMGRDYEGFRSLAPTLLAPRMACEWPFMDAAIELVRGQLAILRGDWAAAEHALRASAGTHQRFRMPMIYGDPRISLAYVYLSRKQHEQYWATFASVLDEVLHQQALGLLLLEPAHVVDALLTEVPAQVARSAAFGAIQARLALWRPERSVPEPAAAAGPLASLSEREAEVLALVARGASNKHIARELSLSLHTVKRHIANILDKLDCVSRGEAADLYRSVASHRSQRSASARRI